MQPIRAGGRRRWIASSTARPTPSAIRSSGRSSVWWRCRRRASASSITLALRKGTRYTIRGSRTQHGVRKDHAKKVAHGLESFYIRLYVEADIIEKLSNEGK